MKKHIIIVGAGYAGVLTAKKLAKRLKKNDVEITLIDKNSYHTMLTEIHEVAADRVDEDHVRVSLKRIFAGRKVDVVMDTITAVDSENKKLTGKNGSYDYDYLVLATGSRPTYFGTPGAEENTFPLWSYEDAVKLKAHILEMFRRAAREPDEAQKRKMLTFYVVGAGFTGVETVGELAEWIPVLCDRFEVNRNDVRIVNVDALDRVVPVFPEKLSAKAERRLKKMGVEVILQNGVCNVGEDFIETKDKDGNIGVHDGAYTIVWTAGVEESPLVTELPDFKHVGRGRLQTDDYLRAIDREDIYVAGDNIFYVPEKQGKPVPQMVENSEMSADTVAHNIVVAITEKGEMEKYAPSFHGAMLSIGGRYGIAEVGTDKWKIALPSFLAMFTKHFIYVIYFIQILGWSKVFSYAKAEFFTVRHKRSFLGGHFSNRAPSFFLVPLRIYLGGYWLYEAIEKISQGWLTKAALADYFSGASGVFMSLVGGGAVDTTASATTVTTAATEAGSLLWDFHFIGLFHVIFIKVSDVAVMVQCDVMDWFNNTFVIASVGTQMFFQYFVVFSELLIGVLLIAGLFTTVSAAFSLILEIMFLMSTGMFMSTWWMIPAAVAMLFGAGQVLSLDYYVMPALKKRWKRVGWVKKSYLYND